MSNEEWVNVAPCAANWFTQYLFKNPSHVLSYTVTTRKWRKLHFPESSAAKLCYDLQSVKTHIHSNLGKQKGH